MRRITVTVGGIAEQPRRQSRQGGGAALIALAIIVAALSLKPQAGTPPRTDTTTATALTPASLSIDQKELRFSAPAAQIIRLTNSGDALLTIQPPVVIGAAFHVSSDCNAPLDRTASCAITVSLDPNAGGNSTGELRITSNGGSATVALISNASPAAPIELQPLNFGRRVLGTAGDPAVVHFTNSALAALTLVNASTATPFSIVKDDCATTIESGVACDVAVSFDPAAAGPQTGDLRIVTTDGRLVAHAALSGEAIAPRPQLPLPPTDFGRQIVGKPGKPRIVTVTNNTSTAIAIGGASTDAPFRILRDGCAKRDLPPTSRCPVEVDFTPTAQDLQTGEIRIAAPDGFVIGRGSLSGFGVPETQIPVRIEIEPATINFKGDPGTRPITVINRGQAPVSISAKFETKPLAYSMDASACDRAPLAPGNQCRILVVANRFAMQLAESERIDITYSGHVEVVTVTFR